MKRCPRCDAATKVYRTEAGNPVIRYRRCMNRDCGHAFKTTQPPEEALAEDTQAAQSFPPAEP